jgi:hypothetical protein
MLVSKREKSDELIDIASKLVGAENKPEFDFLFRTFCKKVDDIENINQVVYFVGRTIKAAYSGNRVEALRFSELVEKHPKADLVDCLNVSNALQSCGLVSQSYQIIKDIKPEGQELSICAQLALRATINGDITMVQSFIDYTKKAYSNQSDNEYFVEILDLEVLLELLGPKAVKLGLVGKALSAFSEKLDISSSDTGLLLSFFNDDDGLTCEQGLTIKEGSISEEQYFAYDDLFCDLLRPAMSELDSDRFIVSLILN